MYITSLQQFSMTKNKIHKHLNHFTKYKTSVTQPPHATVLLAGSYGSAKEITAQIWAKPPNWAKHKNWAKQPKKYQF